MVVQELWWRCTGDPLQAFGNRYTHEFQSSRPLCCQISRHHADFGMKITAEALHIDCTWSPSQIGRELHIRTQGEGHAGVIAPYIQDSAEYWKPSCMDYTLRATQDGGLVGSFATQNNGLEAPSMPVNISCDRSNMIEMLSLASTHVDLQEFCLPKHTLHYLLSRCILEQDLAAGRRVHQHVVESGHELDASLGSHLIRMFTLFDCVVEVNQIFCKLPEPSLFAWDALLLAHTSIGQNEEVIKLYQEMVLSGVRPDGHVFGTILRACSNIAALEQGKLIHAHLVESGFQYNIFVASSLIHMYAKCGNLRDASIVFARLPRLDAVTWSTLIAGFVQHDYGREALRLFKDMIREGLKPDEVTFIGTLKACASAADLDEGWWIHALIIEEGLEPDAFTASTLVDMYAKCGSLDSAHIAFNRLPKRNIVTWSALIAGCVHHEHGVEAFQLYRQMQQEGLQPVPIIFSCILKACSMMATLELGRQTHVLIIERGFEGDVYVGSTLIDMYTKLGSIEDARNVLSRLQLRDIVAWSTLIAGYAQHGYGNEALQLFMQMQQEGIRPNSVTFACILKACSSIADLENGRLFHAHVIGSGFASDTFVGISLIDMYSKCGGLQDACSVFNMLSSRDVVAWSALITGYVQHEHGHEALQLFQLMQEEGKEPDPTAYVSTLKACSSVAALGQGRLVHANIIERGFELDAFIGSTLIDMYSNCGSLEDACTVFYMLPWKTVVTWNAMIACCAQYSDYFSAFKYFEDMQQTGLKPDSVTFLCLFSACGHVGLVDEGCLLFRLMRDNHGIPPSLEHLNSIVDLLGHAGCLTQAEDLLETIPFQGNVVGWMALLNACRTYIDANLGKRCFDYIVSLDCEKVAAYVLMSYIYAHAGMHEEAVIVEGLRKYTNRWKKPAKCFIEISNQVHYFTVGDQKHPQTDVIYDKLHTLSKELKEEGYKPRLDLILDSHSNENKEDLLCGHCEKLAVAFGLLCTPNGMTIRVTKNLRVCADCHMAIKLISKLEKREIIVRDTYCIHRFQDGACCCIEDHEA